MPKYKEILDHDPHRCLVPPGEKLLWSEKVGSRFDFDVFLRYKKRIIPSLPWLFVWAVFMLTFWHSESWSIFFVYSMLLFVLLLSLSFDIVSKIFTGRMNYFVL